MSSQSFEFDDTNIARSVFGHRDEFLRIIEHELTVDILWKGNKLTITGDPADAVIARNVLVQLYGIVADGYALATTDVTRAISLLKEAPDTDLRRIFLDSVITGSSGRNISPKTLTQKHYVDAIRNHPLVFGIGPAGTGKTYLAMAMAVSALLKRKVKRIVLARPAVEAGEKLGFLPGDLQEKVNPYLRPLYDALNEMLDFEKASQWMQRGIIEVAPLAFMRGRTLNDSFIILDEAQNATREQMKMFLTRIGYGSSAVVTGDASQIDLIEKQTSGLTHAARILDGLEGVSIVRFEEVDVVRHPLVRRVVAAYDRQEALEREQELQDDPYQRDRGYRLRPERGPRFENRGWNEPRDWRPVPAAPPAPAAAEHAAEQTGEELPKVEPQKTEGESE
jgi:phosphate starvation-inducible PhoH-like protein